MIEARPADGPLRWTINARDVIVSTCPEWDAFARDNSAEEVTTARILGRSIWDFLSDPTTRQIYERIFAAVRMGRRFSIPFRCDSPTRKRNLLLKVGPAPEWSVAFSSSLVASEERPAVALPASTKEAAPGSNLLVSCGWCKRLLVGDRWLELQPAILLLEIFHTTPPPLLTHGICPDCTRSLERELQSAGES